MSTVNIGKLIQILFAYVSILNCWLLWGRLQQYEYVFSEYTKNTCIRYIQRPVVRTIQLTCDGPPDRTCRYPDLWTPLSCTSYAAIEKWFWNMSMNKTWNNARQLVVINGSWKLWGMSSGYAVLKYTIFKSLLLAIE